MASHPRRQVSPKLWLPEARSHVVGNVLILRGTFPCLLCRNTSITTYFFPPALSLSLSHSTRNFVGSCWNFYQGTLHQKTNDVSNSVARFRRNIKRRPSVRGEKARQPLCMGSAYASQITCVDDVVHAGRSTCSWRAGRYSCQPSIRMDGAAHMRQGRGKNLTSPTETYEARCDLLIEDASSSM